MTVEEEIAEKKNVLVGIRMNRNDRLLLNWALAKVAEPGDHVVALHVSRDSTSEEENSSLLEDYLDVYKGLCTAKQLHLIGKVSHGRSIRKVLVKEAKLCEAMVVVVGINSLNSICGWVSVGNYCAKRLPPTTSVLTVYNGKVIFQRGFTNHLPGIKGDGSQSTNIQGQNPKENIPCPAVAETPMSHSYSKDDNMDACEDKDDNTSPSTSIGGSRTDETFSSTEDRDDTSSNTVDELVKDMVEPMPGWPLLKRASSQTPNVKKPLTRKTSVVQWAMSLPKRTYSLPSTECYFGSEETEVLLERAISRRSSKDNLSAWGELPKELELLLRTNSSRCRWISHKEIMDATSQFSSDNLIAKGGCSSVYKGNLVDGKKVAVKIMKMTKGAWQDYILEVDIISSLKHKHIIPLIGVCLDDNDLILVYKFLSNGSLEENLHGKKEECGLSWEVRFNIAVGVAEAINYLHNECHRTVIHRDIKSSNILLSDEFDPQISDFGLALWASTSPLESHGDVAGTFGYLAPEYFMHGKISEKIDVYSFGVVLLELLSGKKPISTDTIKGQESLVLWAKPILESGEVTALLDPSFSENIDQVQMQRMILAANLCITRTARLRPEMNQILKLLQGEKDHEEWGKCHVRYQEEPENQDDDEVYPDSSAGSQLGLALLDVEDDST
ncbi:hypothetical protein ACHQM5_024612 [Ranunculus cassubicifolius]